jgi:hypothetical protein
MRVPKAGTSWFNLDFSSFDSTVPAFMIRQIFQYFRSKFPESAIDEHTFHFLEEYFIHTPITMYNGIKVKHRGIPSGSYFTSILGSIVNMIVQEYVLLHMPSALRTHLYVLGDDSLSVWSNDRFDTWAYPQRFAELAQELGFNVNPSKTHVWRDRGEFDFLIKFLGMTITNVYPFFHFERDLVRAHAMWPEVDDREPLNLLERLHGLVYAYGANFNIYRYLDVERNLLLRRHPEIKDAKIATRTRDPEMTRYFTFVLANKIDVSNWPKWCDIYHMYTGFGAGMDSYPLGYP